MPSSLEVLYAALLPLMCAAAMVVRLCPLLPTIGSIDSSPRTTIGYIKLSEIMIGKSGRDPHEGLAVPSER
ncbi:hypothetical protein EJB05_28950, partial [Eragrostis curvula]